MRANVCVLVPVCTRVCVHVCALVNVCMSLSERETEREMPREGNCLLLDKTGSVYPSFKLKGLLLDSSGCFNHFDGIVHSKNI